MPNYKIYTLTLLLFTLQFSCKKNTDDTPNVIKVDIKKETLALKADIKKIKYVDYILSSQSLKVTEDWTKFQELQSEIGNLKTGIDAFFKNDFTNIKAFITDLNSSIPENLNVPEVTTRLTVIENCMYNLYAEANLKRDTKDILLKQIKELLVADSNLKLQINKKLEMDNQKIERPN